MSDLRSNGTRGISTSRSASAILGRNNGVEIFNNSYGSEPLSPLTPNGAMQNAIATAARDGRNGLGSIIIFSAGNDRFDEGQQTSALVTYEPKKSSRYTISVAAIGDDGVFASYSTPGFANLVSAPSNGGSRQILTTDRTGVRGYVDGDYTLDRDIDIDGDGILENTGFGGTSAAAPFISGVAALILEANPQLTWLDVQTILVRSSRQIDSGNPSWQFNGGGHYYSPDYGFGIVDAAEAVRLAETWQPRGVEKSWSNTSPIVSEPIGDSGSSNATIQKTINVPGNSGIDRVTAVEVRFTLDHTRRGDLEARLISPSGTVSILAESRSDDADDYNDYVFTTVANWDEVPDGDWTLEIEDKIEGVTGVYNHWRLVLFGANEASDRISRSEPTNVGATWNGEINYAGDVDFYDFWLEKGETVEANIDVPDSDLESYLRLFSASGSEVASDAGFVPRPPFAFVDEPIASIRYTAPESGYYYLGVSAQENDDYDPISGVSSSRLSSFGFYFLNLDYWDGNNSLGEASTLSQLDDQGYLHYGGTTTNAIDYPSDVDLWHIRGAEGQTVQFNLEDTRDAYDDFRLEDIYDSPEVNSEGQFHVSLYNRYGQRLKVFGVNAFFPYELDDGNPANEELLGLYFSTSSRFTFPSTDDYYIAVTDRTDSYDILTGRFSERDADGLDVSYFIDPDSDIFGEDRISYRLSVAPLSGNISATTDHTVERPDKVSRFDLWFNESVDLQPDYLQIVNLQSGLLVDPSFNELGPNGADTTATSYFSFPGLDPGIYGWTADGSKIISKRTGLALDANDNGSPGGVAEGAFYVALPGDANLDGKVDVLGDAFSLVGNLGLQGGASWADGDFNGDGKVDVLGDGFVLVSTLGQSVIPVTTSQIALEPISFQSGSFDQPDATQTNESRDIVFAKDSFSIDDRKKKRISASGPDRFFTPATVEEDGETLSLA